jgi:hypothetical protein
MIYEDFERESQKDLVYLLEAKAILEEDYWNWLRERERLPAKIETINETSNPTENEQLNILPFRENA